LPTLPDTVAPRHDPAIRAAPAAPHVDPQRVLQQVALAVADAGGSSEIRLDPVELGQLRFTLQPTDTGILVTLAAERAETADLLRRHAQELAADLRDLGYAQVDLAFADHRAPQDSRPQPESPAEPAPPQTEPTTAVTPSRHVSTQALDIRM
jgi:flagellar hook-length control protein FliK